MTEAPLREAVVRKRPRVPIIWMIPLVTVLAAGWLWYRAVQERGPVIEITFATADGLEAGKTLIKYKDMEVGTVTELRFSEDLAEVVATAEMNAGAEGLLTDRARFWVVLPRIGADGVTGLGTIVSGSHIDMEVSAEGAPTRSFRALEEPPSRPVDAPGLRLVLEADDLGSLGRGSRVSHLGIPMGEVDGYRFLREEGRIAFDVYVDVEHADLIRANTRFWNASGFDVTLNADGFDVHMDSITTLLAGGVSFATPPGMDPGEPVQAGHVFELFKTPHEAFESSSEPRRSVIYFREPIDGLKVGAPVNFQGIEVGHVLDLGVTLDKDTLEFAMPVVIETFAGRLEMRDSDVLETHDERIRALVENGLRARLGPSNLVTGARGVVVEFAPDVDGDVFGGDLALPEIPTVPSTGAALGDMLERLPGIVADLATTVDALARLTESDEVTASLTALASATVALDALLDDASQEAGPLLDEMRATLTEARDLVANLDGLAGALADEAPGLLASLAQSADSAETLLESSETGVRGLMDGMPTLQYELLQALREVRAGMRAVGGLAETLDRHPEALLSGKPSSGGD